MEFTKMTSNDIWTLPYATLTKLCTQKIFLANLAQKVNQLLMLTLRIFLTYS